MDAVFSGVTKSGHFRKRIARHKCPPQSNATGELVEHAFPVNVSCPAASDVLHPTMRHPHLQRETERCTVTWTDILRTVYHSCLHAHSLNVHVEKVLKNSGTQREMAWQKCWCGGKSEKTVTGSRAETSVGILKEKKCRACGIMVERQPAEVFAWHLCLCVRGFTTWPQIKSYIFDKLCSISNDWFVSGLFVFRGWFLFLTILFTHFNRNPVHRLAKLNST